MGKRSDRQNRKSRPSLTITDLIDKPILQALQDRFSEKYRVPTAILDRRGNPITFERRHTAYCKEIRRTIAGYNLCRSCDRKLITLARRSGHEQWRICEHGGLLDFAAPLRVDNKTAAFLFTGQIRGKRGRKKTDGILKHYARLRAQVKKEDGEKRLSHASLRIKFARIRVRKEEEIDKIEAGAVEFAKDLSRTLTKLKEWQRPHAVSQFIAKMALAIHIDGLFETCVSQIPKLLGTKYCSIFTVVRGKKRAAPKLVLRKTNFSKAQNREGTAAYRKGQGLTGWVWKNARSLRLDNIKNKLELDKYPDLKWSNTMPDSDHHREWLGVPLFGAQGDVIGVIRVPEKKRTGRGGGGGFTFEDEVLLLTIGQHVARQIEELSAVERIGLALRASQECAVRLGRAANYKSVAEILVTTCKRIFGTDGKLHALIMLSEDRHNFRVEASTGSLGGKDLDKKEFPAGESLGGLVLRKGRALIIHDVAKARQKKQYYPAVPALSCAMSAPVCFGDKDYGILSVGADRRYEFSEEPDLHIVRDLASIAGATLARLDAERESKAALVKFSEEMGHTLFSRIATLETTISTIRSEEKSKQAAAIADEIEEAVEFFKRTADVGVRLGQTRRQTNLRMFKLADVITNIQMLYRRARVSCSARGSLVTIGDPEMIETILVELIENALRFVDKSSGRVSVRAFHKRSSPGKSHPQPWLIIEVSDNGPGVSKSQKEEIFNPYQTSDDSRTGLGLSIVKAVVVEVHGGHIEERGRPGHGACFRIMLPE